MLHELCSDPDLGVCCVHRPLIPPVSSPHPNPQRLAHIPHTQGDLMARNLPSGSQHEQKLHEA